MFNDREEIKSRYTVFFRHYVAIRDANKYLVPRLSFHYCLQGAKHRSRETSRRNYFFLIRAGPTQQVYLILVWR